MTYFRDMTKTDAFAEYGAVLNNPVNEYSAVAEDDSVVVECWGHLIKRIADGVWRYHVDDFFANGRIFRPEKNLPTQQHKNK